MDLLTIGKPMALEKAEFEMNEVLKEKFKKLELHQLKRAEKAMFSVQKCRNRYPAVEVLSVPMVYEIDGFSILKQSADALIPQ